MKITLVSLEKNIHGRHAFTEDGGLLISWNLSGFSVHLCADSATVHFGDVLCEDAIYVRADVDGELWGYGRADKNGVFKIDGLSSGEHTLTFRRVGGSVATLEIAALEIPDGAQILPPPPVPPLRIEFIGDSITYGYGLLYERWDGFQADTDGDGTGGYAYRTASALGAEIRTEAISGQGIVCKFDGTRGKPIPEFFEYDDTELTLVHDFGSWIPDVVVINAGTNDAGGKLAVEPFCEGVDAFLGRVREVYPNAEVFYAYGIMGNVYAPSLRALIEKRAVADKKLHLVLFEPISDSESGPMSHPNCKGHMRAAVTLTDAIRAVIGEK